MKVFASEIESDTRLKLYYVSVYFFLNNCLTAYKNVVVTVQTVS